MKAIITIAALAAGLAPLLPASEPALQPAVTWPASFEGQRLTPMTPAPEDAALAKNFPGRIARFTDGKRQIVLRSVATATRQLHPARDCFKAIGYAITPAPMRVTAAGTASCFEARREGRAVLVCERITDAAGQSFADASAWYWSALLGSSTGPWLATTIVEPIG